MESLDTKSATGFFKHIFNFEEDSKNDMSNIIQYSILSIIPIVMLNKSMQKYVPEADNKKGSLELLAEISFQIVYMFLGILFIHRIIIYIPTYSGMKYPEFNVIFIILAVLMVILSLQTKLGDKVGIIVDRINDLWEGNSSNTKDKKTSNDSSNNVKISQPISQGQIAMKQSLYSDGTSLSQLPDMSQQVQQLPDYNSAYKQQSTPLIGAASPVDEQFNGGGIMAANEMLGGSGFGSAW